MNFIKMNSSNGYIYVRNHPSYDVDDACKMCKANNIPERDTQYATGEIKRGYFEAVFEVPIFISILKTIKTITYNNSMFHITAHCCR